MAKPGDYDRLDWWFDATCWFFLTASILFGLIAAIMLIVEII